MRGKNKSPFLHDLATNRNCLWVAVTETWLNPGILDSEMLVHMPGYTIFRQDRKGRQRGGVCLFLREDLTGEVLSSSSNGVCEFLIVNVHQLNTVVIVIYRPPDTGLHEFGTSLSKIEEVLNNLPTPTPTITLMGDLNFPASAVTWEHEEGVLLPRVAGHRVGHDSEGGQVRQQAARLCNMAAKFHLTQHVGLATREKEILDLVWSSNPDLVSHIQVDTFKAFTDHSVVTATTSYRLGGEVDKEENFLLNSGKRFKRLDFNNAPWPEIKKRLGAVDWGPMKAMAKDNVTAAHSLFMSTLLPILEELVPARRIGKKFGLGRKDKSRRCLWRKLGRVKKKLLITKSVTRATQLLQTKQTLEKELKKSYDIQGWNDESRVVNAMKTNAKAFFAYGRAKQKTKAKVGPFLDPVTGIPNPDPDFAANLLSDQYKSVFTTPRPEYAVNDLEEFFSGGSEWRQQHQGRPLLNDIKFTEVDIEMACKELKSSSSPGPDGVPAVLLKTACHELRRPLFLLWRASLNQGVIPPDLLLVLISPVHKGGSRGMPANYRPVALTSHIMKVFERVIRRWLVAHLEDNDLLPDGQHGFRAKRSCLTQLLSYWDNILDQMEEGKGVDAVYTDFAKAFDKCETGVLLHRLKECGIRGKTGHWIAAFLDPQVRKQAVGVEGRLSPLVPVISGVPQGTVLGPCLFLVHLMGISTNISAGTISSSFADDTRLQRGIVEESDCVELQRDLDKVYSWSEEIGMVFNAGKFELLRFWLDREAAPDILYMAPDGGPIEEKDCLRDLGVRISTDLSFNVQIDMTVMSSSKMAGWALRSFRRRGKYLMLTILRTLIQPRLDYCSQLWSPRDQFNINQLEGVQRQFLSEIKEPALTGLSYWEVLSELRVYSQERRRERYQICFLWKESQGLVDGYSFSWQWSDRRGRLAIPTNIPRSAPTKVSQARERSLGVHGPRLFNLLPRHLRNENSGDFALFKNHLDIFLSTVPDQPTTPGLGRAAVSNSLLEQIPLIPNFD